LVQAVVQPPLQVQPPLLVQLLLVLEVVLVEVWEDNQHPIQL
jgi:hypothetical protein